MTPMLSRAVGIEQVALWRRIDGAGALLSSSVPGPTGFRRSTTGTMGAATTHSHRHRRAVTGRSVLVLVPLLLIAALPAAGQSSEPRDPVRVFYPKGDCATGVIEIELWNRAAQAWEPHPAHPRIMADTCQTEDAGDLLNEIRVRCTDPASPARASDWTLGVQVYEPAGAPGCEPPEIGLSSRISPRIRLTDPPADRPLRTATAVATLAGQVQLTHDLAVLVDTSFDPDAMKSVIAALDALIERDADLLGPLRIAFVLFAGDPAAAGTGRIETTPPSDDRQRLHAQIARLADPKRPVAARGLGAGIDAALASLGKAPEPGDRQTLLVLVDGTADLPFGPGAGMSPTLRREIQTAVDAVVRAGVALEIVVLGRDERQLAELAGQIHARILSGRAGGGLIALERVDALAQSLPDLTFTSLREVRVENLATGGVADPLEWDRAGRFAGSIPMRSGKNPLRVRALLSNGQDVIADFERQFDPSALRDALRAGEAKRIERARDAASQKKGSVTLEVEDR